MWRPEVARRCMSRDGVGEAPGGEVAALGQGLEDVALLVLGDVDLLRQDLDRLDDRRGLSGLGQAAHLVDVGAEARLIDNGADHVAHLQAHTAKSYDRAVEFEAMGGKLLDLPASSWREIVEAE